MHSWGACPQLQEKPPKIRPDYSDWINEIIFIVFVFNNKKTLLLCLYEQSLWFLKKT